MSESKVLKWFSYMGILAGILVALVPTVYAISPDSVVYSLVDLSGIALALFGFVAVYVGNAEKLGKYGFFSFCVVFVGWVLHFWMKATSAFVKPLFMEYAPQVLDENKLGALGVALNLELIVFTLGQILFGLAIAKTKGLPRAAGVLWMFGPFGVFVPVVGIFLGPPMWGVGMFLLIRHLFKNKYSLTPSSAAGAVS